MSEYHTPVLLEESVGALNITPSGTYADLTFGGGGHTRRILEELGEGLKIDVVGGNDFPDDLMGYDIVIHCGACMFNRRTVMSRVRQAKAQGVPITNYGIAIAALSGILDRVVI